MCRNVNLILGVIFFTCIGLSTGENHTLPSYIIPCNRADSDLRKCIKENIQKLKPNLKDGIPDLFVPSLDPLLIPPTCVNEEDQVKVVFKDIQIYNADEFKLNEFDIDLEHHKVHINITFPQLRIKATYNVTGKFLVVNFDESGPADGNYTNFHLNLSLKGTPYEENGKDYLEWQKESISINIENSHVVLDKLFGNHTDITDMTNKVINENIDVIIKDLEPVIQRVVSDFIFGTVNKLFATYSVKELFVH